MNDQETKTLSEIAVKVGRLEALQEANAKAINDMATGVNRLVSKLDQSDDIAREADQRARSAHHRIDDLDKKIGDTKDDIKFLWRAVLTAIITVGIGGVSTLVWKAVGGGH